jgi:ABC-type amino acid transport substrate-binding protein
MGKIIGSVAFLIAIIVGGYFADPGFHEKVNGMLGKGGAQVSAVRTTQTEPTAWEAKKGSTLSNIIDSGVVHASVQDPSKPFYYKEGARAKGFNVDFMNILFAQNEFRTKVGIKVEASAVDSYPDVPKQLLDGKKVDIAIDGLTFNDEDLKGVKYTIPYVKDFGYALITPKGVNVNNVADLAGAKVGIIKGDPDVKSFVEGAFPGATIVEVSDKADESGKFIAGHFKAHRIDAMVYDYPFAVAEVEGTNLQFAMTKIKGSDIQYRIGVRDEDKDLLAALNGAIRKAMDTPEYTEMLKQYFMSNSVAAVRRASSGEVSYVVVKGDTLSTIAASQLGDLKRYPDIQARNNLANPNFIAVGQKLIIPSK